MTGATMPTADSTTMEAPVVRGRKRWQDFTRTQKTGIIVQGALQLALTSWTLWDVHHRKPDQLRGNRWLWTGLAFVQPIGPIAYLLFGRRRQGEATRSQSEATHG